MAADLAVHDAVVRAAIDAQAGYVFSTAGDAFSAAFANPVAAVIAAVDAQRGLSATRWGVTGGLQVRMGIHSGRAFERGGDYFGPTLNLTARLMAAAHGGQIVVSGSAVALGCGEETVSLGQHRLRDIAEPIEVHQIRADGLGTEFASLVSLGASLSTLPEHRSSFIGRSEEVDRVRHLIGESRVVTITGVGGAGKTRLAIEAAAANHASHSGGVFFVDLASIEDPSQVEVAVTKGIGLQISNPDEGRGELERFLLDRSALLVFDNCEHVLDEVAGLVDELLRAAPGLRVLATSREALEVEGERTFRVPSLDPGSAGLRLFVERATAVDDRFALSDANRASVIELCERLDGLPLAIELAASRVRTFSPAQLVAHINDRFALLGGGRRRAAVGRQRTLEATIAWSHDLLADDERTFFRRLCTFSGPFVFDVVPTVTDFPEPQARDLLESLVAKSLVVPVVIDAEQRAFRLLETVRAYAAGLLVDAGEVDTTAERHLEAYLQYCQDGWLRRSQWAWGRSYRTQLSTIWNAVDHALEAGRAAGAWDMLEVGSMTTIGSGVTGAEMLERLEDLAHRHVHDLDDPRRARLLGALAMSRMTAGRVLESVTQARDDLAAHRHLPPVHLSALTTNQAVSLSVLDPDAGVLLLDDFLDSLGSTPEEAIAAEMTGYMKAACLASQRRYEEATTLAEQTIGDIDSFTRDNNLAIAMWAAHLGGIVPDQAMLATARGLDIGDGGWRFSTRISAAMHAASLDTAALEVVEVADRGLTGRIPFEEAEFLVAFARIAHLSGDDDRAVELLDATASRSPWTIFAMAETLGTIHDWPDGDWDARRVEMVMSRNQPERMARDREHGPRVLAAEINRWR